MALETLHPHSAFRLDFLTLGSHPWGMALTLRYLPFPPPLSVCQPQSVSQTPCTLPPSHCVALHRSLSLYGPPFARRCWDIGLKDDT